MTVLLQRSPILIRSNRIEPFDEVSWCPLYLKQLSDLEYVGDW